MRSSRKSPMNRPLPKLGSFHSVSRAASATCRASFSVTFVATYSLLRSEAIEAHNRTGLTRESIRYGAASPDRVATDACVTVSCHSRWRMERGAEPNVNKVLRRALRAISAWTSPLLPDDYLELINPLWSTRELRGRVESIEREAGNAV